MKKLIFISTSIILALSLSIIVLQFYNADHSQENLELRTDHEQDAQVKNTEAMLSNSLTEVIDNLENRENKNTQTPPNNMNISSLSNHSSNE